MSFSQRAYFAMPVGVQNVLVSAYGYYLKRKREGFLSKTASNVIAHSRSWKRSDVEEYQSKELARLVRLCASLVPYYADAWRREGIAWAQVRSAGDLALLPLLPKETVRRRSSEIMRRGARPFWTQHTSGSTGTPIVVHVNRRTYRLVHALLEAHESDCGVGRRDVRATFAGRMVQPPDRLAPPFWRYNRAQRQILFSAYHLSQQTLPYYVAELERRQPAELIGYPSAIAVLAAYINASARPASIRPRVVITNSETLYSWQRHAIERAFRCPVRDYYGSAEALVFAPQCAAGAYHFDPLLGIAEVVDAGGRPVGPGATGRLVCTTLVNDVMPLVRYEIGDAAVKLEGPCPCGSVLDGAREIIGREDDMLLTPDGRAVGRIDHIFKGVIGIQECQIVQEALDFVRLMVIADETFDATQEQLLLRNTRSRLGDSVRLEVARVAAIPRNRAGKFRGVLTRLGGGTGDAS